MTRKDPTRRLLLKTSGAALAIGLAGCLGGDDGGNGGNGDDGGDDGDEVEEWMSNANEYDGLEDYTGQDEVTVEVGAGAAGTAYSPAGIEIDQGTTVVWEWTGLGGDHDVVENDGAFQSDLVKDEGETFEHTFDEPGTYTYYCTPHEAVGMKGAIVVE